MFTTELEQEFMKTFGIEKRKHAFLLQEPNGSKEYYPKITDRVLLELICICTYYTGFKLHNLWIKNPYELKVFTLQDIMLWYSKREFNHEKCKEQIQSLFGEEEE